MNKVFISKAALIACFGLLSINAADCSNCPRRCNCTDGTKVKCDFPTVQTFSEDDFPKNTTILDLSGNNLLRFSLESLNELANIQELNLDNNKIYSIENGAFKDATATSHFLTLQGQESMLKLTAKDNNIHFMESNTFSYLPRVQEINLSKNHLKKFPNLEKNMLLEILSLSSNDITSIPSGSLKANTHLRELYLKSMDIKSLPRDVFSNDVSNFTVLDLSDNRLWNTPTVVREMINLKALYLSSNPIKAFNSDDFRDLKSLKTMALSEVGMEEFPKNWYWLSELEHLDISRNEISGNGLGKIEFSSLLTLKIMENPLRVIDSNSFEKLTKLEVLDLRSCGISGFHERTFTSLQNLKKLDLRDNNLSELPRLQENRRLEEIILDNNNINSLRLRNFRDMENLKVLSIANNSLIALGDRSDDSSVRLSLSTLILSGNKFVSMPESAVFEMMPSLKSLDMSKNLLSRRFNLSSISVLGQLETINLRNNKITAIVPDVDEAMWNMEKLHLCDNNLTSLDSSMLNRFPKLLELTADNNAIRGIYNFTFFTSPLLEKISIKSNNLEVMEYGSFKPLLELKELMLQFNKLTEIPSISSNSKLKILGLCNNPVKNIRERALSGPSNLESILLGALGITSLERNIFGNIDSVEKLDLSKNNLTAIPTIIRNMTSLRILKLTGNPITSLSARCLEDLVNLREIHLDNMRLSSMDIAEFFPTFPALRSLWLSGNPWRCDCGVESFALGEDGTRSRVATMDRSEIKCTEPARLKGKSIDCLQASDFRYCRGSEVTDIQETSALVRLPYLSGFGNDVSSHMSYMPLPGREKVITLEKDKREVRLSRLIPDTRYLVCTSVNIKDAEDNPSDRDGDAESLKPGLSKKPSRETAQEICTKFKTLKPSFQTPWAKGGMGGSAARSQHLLVIYIVLGGSLGLTALISTMASIFWCKRRQMVLGDGSDGTVDSGSQSGLDGDTDLVVDDEIDIIKDEKAKKQAKKDAGNGDVVEITLDSNQSGRDNPACNAKVTPQRTKL